MRKYLGLAIGIVIAVSSVAVVPTAQARWSMCDTASSCSKLKASCKEADGSYGQVTYPDGSVWGYCSA